MAVPPQPAQRVERRRHLGRIVGPRRRDRRLVVEHHQRVLVVSRQQLEQEAVQRLSRIGQPQADHAVADIEQHGQADRHALVRELGDRLRQAVFEELELVLRKVGDQPPFGVGDGHGDRDDLDAGLEALPGRLRQHPARAEASMPSDSSA